MPFTTYAMDMGDVELEFNPNWDPLMPNRGGPRITGSDATSPVFHMLVLTPSKSSIVQMPDLMVRIGSANGSVGVLNSAAVTPSANESVDPDYEWVQNWVTLLGIWQMVVACIGKCIFAICTYMYWNLTNPIT